MTRLLLTLLTLLGLGLFGCADGPNAPATPDAPLEPDAPDDPDAPVLARLELRGMTTLVPGSVAQVWVTAYDTNGGQMVTPELVWASSTPAVADVSSTGEVTAYTVGAAVISARSGNVTAWLAFGVYEAQAAVDRVELLPDGELALAQGEVSQLNVFAYDALDNALDGRVITWSNTDASVAAIGPNGIVTALAVGTTTITVECEGKTDSLVVRVHAPVARIVLSHTEATIVSGETLQLTALLYDAANQPITDVVTWSSDHPEHVIVTPNGMLIGNAEGGAIITATSGSATATVTVFTTHWTERTLVSVNGAPPPATMFTSTTIVNGVERELELRAEGGVLAIRWVDSRYEMMVFGLFYVAGEASDSISYTSVGEIHWNAANQVFELWPDDVFSAPFIGRYISESDGHQFAVEWNADPNASPATLVFGD